MCILSMSVAVPAVPGQGMPEQGGTVGNGARLCRAWAGDAHRDLDRAGGIRDSGAGQGSTQQRGIAVDQPGRIGTFGADVDGQPRAGQAKADVDLSEFLRLEAQAQLPDRLSAGHIVSSGRCRRHFPCQIRDDLPGGGGWIGLTRTGCVTGDGDRTGGQVAGEERILIRPRGPFALPHGRQEVRCRVPKGIPPEGRRPS